MSDDFFDYEEEYDLLIVALALISGVCSGTIIAYLLGYLG